MRDEFKTGKNPYLGALDDDETPVYRTWQCQILKSEAKRALQSTPENRDFRKRLRISEIKIKSVVEVGIRNSIDGALVV